MQLRNYQKKLADNILQYLSNMNVLAVAPTGAGKTVLFSYIIKTLNVKTVAIAHRQELVSQISLALAKNDVKHNIISNNVKLINFIKNLHKEETGKCYFDKNSHISVGGVDTIIKMSSEIFKDVKLWVMDEAHHVLKNNKWGKCVAMFTNATGLGVTATPIRSDGKGLGVKSDGVFDILLQSVSMRNLINDKYLTDYKIYAPKSDIDMSNVGIGASGEFVQDSLRKAVHKSKIVGDVVSHYIKLANNKQGVTFAVDVESATDIAVAYRNAGIKAEVVSAKTNDYLRQEIIKRFRKGDIQQLVNVDLFGEGFDLPAIEVVSFARPTCSFSLYSQQFGRALRILDGKLNAIIIDHVGNVMRHGLPDAFKNWSLESREKKSSSKEKLIQIKTCPECMAVYHRILGNTCPECGITQQIQSRSSIEQVDGDLFELSPEVLERMRNKIDEEPKFPYNASPVIINSINKNFREKQETQEILRIEMLKWQKKQKLDIRKSQIKFYLDFGVDVLTAQTLNKKDAIELIKEIQNARE